MKQFNFIKRGLTGVSRCFSVVTVVLLMTVFSLSAFADSAFDDLLHFVAGANNVTVQLNKSNSSMADVSLEYSVNRGAWTTYTWDASTGKGASINLNNNGDKVYFRAKTTLTKFNNDYDYFTFSFSGTVAGGGSVMSLLCPTGNMSTIPSTYCFGRLFLNCSTLTVAPALPATTITKYCYLKMFEGCKSLKSAPALPATILADFCYHFMFYGCTSLTVAPALPATTLAHYCYGYMFYQCASLTSAPALPATTLASTCYKGMFQGCTSLKSAPALPVTTLASSCYHAMFFNCTSLTASPFLPQPESFASDAYKEMFKGCGSLNLVTTSFDVGADWNVNNSTADWLSGVAEYGTFIGAPGSVDPTTRGASTIPIKWNCQVASTSAYRNKNMPAQAPESEPDTTTDLSDTLNDNNSSEPFKIIENGRVVIIKNGIKYDMFGNVIR